MGPAAQTYGYGFGVGNFGGTVSGVATTDLDGTLAADDTAGNNGTSIQIRLLPMHLVFQQLQERLQLKMN